MLNGFENDLKDLRYSCSCLAEAADAAGAALTAVHGNDVPTGPTLPSFFGGGRGLVDNAFGTTLGMPQVASAYSAHVVVIENLLRELFKSTVDASHALQQVADVYERADADSTNRLHRAATGLTEH